MFENLKQWMLRRLERDSIKSELDGEVVYMKKSKLPILGGGWVQIHPPVNEDNSWNLVNLVFGGWRNLKILIVMLVLVGMILYAFKNVFTQYEALRNLPCVQQCLEIASQGYNPFN